METGASLVDTQDQSSLRFIAVETENSMFHCTPTKYFDSIECIQINNWNFSDKIAEWVGWSASFLGTHMADFPISLFIYI